MTQLDNSKNYKVVIELEVLADDKHEAYNNAIADIKELDRDGTLEPVITEIEK